MQSRETTVRWAIPGDHQALLDLRILMFDEMGIDTGAPSDPRRQARAGRS